jgi:hypothetical protein
LACTGVAAYLLTGPSSPSYLEVLRKVVAVGDVQLDSHAKAQSLVGDGLDVPRAHVLTADGLLDALENQEVERMAGHVGT